jgi:hypothetical protein
MFLFEALAQRCSVDGPPSFKVMFLCGALAQRYSVDGPPSTLCFCVGYLRANASHKNISLKDHLQNTPGLMLHKKTLLLKEDQLQNTSGVMLHTKTYL